VNGTYCAVAPFSVSIVDIEPPLVIRCRFDSGPRIGAVEWTARVEIGPTTEIDGALGPAI